jgi:peptidyl-prolyl cis-trans isomerase B (cyclophilin B)
MRKSKRLSIVAIFALTASLVITAPSLANDASKIKTQKISKTEKSERSSKGPRCLPTSATSHAPIDVLVPESAMTPRQLSRAMKQIVIETNCGEIVIQPNYRARLALTAMHALVKGGYFDQSLCHRLVTEGIFVLQCGDPTATGNGFPNFTFNVLENTPRSEERNYPEGTVAMANMLYQGERLMGSQFFIVYEDSTLDPDYTIFGRVTKGLDIVKMVARAGIKEGTTFTPKQTIAIEKASIK